jgi:DNA-binding transcriptional ArsR family regulator
MDTTAAREGRDTLKLTASAALRHPMRVRILEVLNERDMSPVEFLHLGLAPKVEKSQLTLSHISYHFRQLAEDGCLEIIERVPRRGATQHVYRGCARACFSDEEWAQLTPDEQRHYSRAIYQGIAARAEGAMMADTFDSRDDRHMTWNTMDLDEQGWSDLMATLMDCFEAVERIRCEAKERLEEAGEEGIHTTFGLLGFESPQPRPS